MGKISPFEIMGETYANALRWVHFFLPVALVVALVGTVLNSILMDTLVAADGSEVATVPDNFWTIWFVVMLGILAVQTMQLSLFDAIMERREAWFSFGLARALRRMVPALVGMVLFILAYLLGTILLLIPGVMALFLLYMMLPLILLDDVGPFAALKKSWQLTWGNAWRLFAAMLLTLLPVGLAFWALAFAFGVVSMDSAQALQPTTSLSDWRTWLWILLTGVIGVFVASFYLVAFQALKAANSGESAVAETVTA